jgi:sugar diacid utilization regulator
VTVTGGLTNVDGPRSLDALGTAPCLAAVQAFAAIAPALHQVDDLDALLHLVASGICELVGVHRCSIYLCEDDSGVFRGRIGHSGHNFDERIRGLVAGLAADRFTREIVETRRPVVLVDALGDARPIHSTMRAWKVCSMLGVPMVLGHDVIGVMFLDEEDERHVFESGAHEAAAAFALLAAASISQAKSASELRSRLAAAERQIELLKRSAAFDDRLSGVVLGGGGVLELVQAVADMTSKPTAVHDERFRPIATAVPAWERADVVPPLLEMPYRTSPEVAEAVEAVSGTRGRLIGPLPMAGLHHRFLLVPVPLGDLRCGHLVVMEHGCAFGPLDLHLARRAATSIAVELSAERRAASAEWDAQASLVLELVRGNRDVAELSRRAQFLGVDLRAPHVLCWITADGPGAGEIPAANDLVEALANVSPDASVLGATVDDGIIAVVELSRPATPQDVVEVGRRVTSALDHLGVSPGVAAALSSRCTGAGDYFRAFTEVRQIMQCLRTLTGGGTRVLSADDLGPGRLLLASSGPGEAERFANDVLGALVNDNGVRDLLLTLRVFFDGGRSIRRAAITLAVHENTIRYRLARVQEITGLAVGSNSDDQLTAQLALLVLRLRGRLGGLSTPTPPTRAVEV